MEGSQISARNSGWKSSILKDGQRDSRIMENSRVNQDLPAKFSPSKNIEANPKLFARSNILSRSDDSFRMDKEKDRSSSKDGFKMFKGVSMTPKADSPSFKLTFNNLGSQKSLEQNTLSPKKNLHFMNDSANSADYLHEIKLEYLRFKDRIMKELKKLQNQIRTAIQEVMNVVQINSSQLANQKLLRSSSFESKAMFTPSFNSSEVQFTNKFPKPTLPQGSAPSVDTSKYRQVLTGSTVVESVLPKIKQRMGKFFDLMGQLKTQIDSQTLYSPVKIKQRDLGSI